MKKKQEEKKKEGKEREENCEKCECVSKRKKKRRRRETKCSAAAPVALGERETYSSSTQQHTAAHSSTPHIIRSNHTRNAPLALRTAVPPASTGVQHRQSSRHTPVSPPALTFASSRSAWHCHRHATQHWYELPSTLTDRVRLLTRRQPSRCQRGRLGGRREEEQGRRRKREYE